MSAQLATKGPTDANAEHVKAITGLIDAYCAAWNESDENRRRSALQGIWCENAAYVDPAVEIHGIEPLCLHISAVMSRRTEAQVRRTSSVDVHRGCARFAWQLVEADGSTLPETLNIVEIGVDGKIARVIGFFGPLKEKPRPAAKMRPLIHRQFAKDLAMDWIDAWNTHDLERILEHYDDDFEMSSPIIAEIFSEASGKLRGKERVRAYWKLALSRVPDLRFSYIDTLVGSDTITVLYQGPRGISGEVLQIGPSGKVCAAFAHYSSR